MTPKKYAKGGCIPGYAEGGEVDDAVNNYILGQFGAPKAPQAPTGPSGFDVSAMGPNMDDTLKAPPVKQAPQPVNTQDIPPAAQPLPELPPPATPTGAPAPKTPENEKVVSSHAGLSQDDLEKYLADQKGQLDKYGPDAEAAVMDDIKRRYNSPGNILAKGGASLADGIMQGVARAGNSNFRGRISEDQNAEANREISGAEHLNEANLKNVAAKQGLDAMDPQGSLGKAMLSSWGPLLDKMGVPKDQQAKMIPSLVGSIAPELVKDKEAQARIAAAKEQKNMMLGIRQDQFDQNQWVKLGNAVNALNAGSRKALGIAASNNMRADRALETIDNPKLTKSPQLVTQLVQDVSGIYKGGAPDEVSLKHSMYPNLMADLAKAESYLTSQPESGATKALLNQIREQVMSLKQIDNQAIEKNLGISAVEFEPIIKKDPSRWARMTGAVQQIEHGPEARNPGQNQPVSAEMPTVSSQAEYEALPKGATYVGPDGKQRRKG